jgi:hypothetical protein
VERDELRVSLGEAKKRIKELAGELKARTLERDEALAAASANSGGNGAAHASSSPVAASYASSTSPIVPGVNRRRSNDNDGDDSREEGSRRPSAAASLFRDVGLDRSDEDSNEEVNEPSCVFIDTKRAFEAPHFTNVLYSLFFALSLCSNLSCISFNSCSMSRRTGLRLLVLGEVAETIVSRSLRSW